MSNSFSSRSDCSVPFLMNGCLQQPPKHPICLKSTVQLTFYFRREHISSTNNQCLVKIFKKVGRQDLATKVKDFDMNQKRGKVFIQSKTIYILL